jgi:hypothetical protein
MHAYRYGEDEKEDKGDTAHGIAEEPCVGFFWYQSVIPKTSGSTDLAER